MNALKAWLLAQLAHLTWRRILYAFITGAGPIVAFLSSAEPITARKLATVLLGSLVAAATADRAYLDSSHAAEAATAAIPRDPGAPLTDAPKP